MLDIFIADPSSFVVMQLMRIVQGCLGTIAARITQPLSLIPHLGILLTSERKVSPQVRSFSDLAGASTVTYNLHE